MSQRARVGRKITFIVGLILAFAYVFPFFLVFAIGVFGDIAAYVKDIPKNEESQWNRNARQAPPAIFMAITAVGVIALWYFQFMAIGA